MSDRRRIGGLGASLLLALALAGCGFQPVYKGGDRGVTVPQMAAISVAPIDDRLGWTRALSESADRLGQVVRNHLLDLLTPRGAPARPLYRLEVKLRETKDGLALEQDESVTRFNLTLHATFEMNDLRTDQMMLEGSTRAIAAYNVVRSDYANLIAERDARSRSSQEVAQEIKTRIAVYFRRQAQTARR